MPAFCPLALRSTTATAIDNNGDIAGWGTDASGNTNQAFVIMNPHLPGDANGDGRVDINDLTIVLSHFGQTGMTWTQGEFTGDGTVDINDLTDRAGPLRPDRWFVGRRNGRRAGALGPFALGRRPGCPVGLCPFVEQIRLAAR